MIAHAALVALVMQVGVSQPRVGFTRDSVRVGDLLGVAIQLEVPANATVAIADTLDVSGDIENAAPKRVQIDTLPNALWRYRITYPITAWRPGTLPLPALAASVRTDGQETPLQIALPPLNVMTVLPADTAGIEPKPPRDVWGASRLWWPILLAALLLLLLIGLAIWWWRRRPKAEAAIIPIEPALAPREWALRELDALQSAHLIERGEYQRYYIRLSGILRQYLERLDDMWGTDLTTREVADRLYAARADARAPIDVLSRADLVKFARQQHGAEQAGRDFTASRQWVEKFVKPELIVLEAA